MGPIWWTTISSHDYEHEGNILEEICFENLDILEHREHQANYLGCLAINVGDKNTARNICYKNIRIEPFKWGGVMHQEKLFPMVRKQVQDVLNGYIPHKVILEDMDQYIVPPALGEDPGVLGAIRLGMLAM